jgi:hypothetical protein
MTLLKIDCKKNFVVVRSPIKIVLLINIMLGVAV